MTIFDPIKKSDDPVHFLQGTAWQGKAYFETRTCE